MKNSVGAIKYHEGAFPYSDRPHIAVAGRSNVGKSSLLNALMQKKVASTSRAPGRTKAIWCFPWQERVLGDLPGFGYAKVGSELRDIWSAWMFAYFGAESPLRATVLCLDAKLPPQTSDLNFLDWLAEQTRRPLILAATRTDRLNQKETHLARRHLDSFQQRYQVLNPLVLLTSAQSRLGIDNLEKMMITTVPTPLQDLL